MRVKVFMKGKEKTAKDEKGITVEKDEFSEWFTQIMVKADLADYSSVSGCIVFRPTAYAIWEQLKAEVDKRFKKIGIQNAYFPLLIPEKLLTREAEHVKGFSPQVAWVTRAGDTELKEKLAVRPTSEAIMYESYSKWIRSWRDLPLKINQWNSVVRWEFSHPVPFFRTREFLWNEGHNVYSNARECLEDGKKILEAYDEVCREFMALYGMTGKKTEQEKFAGAVSSEKIHYILPSGRVVEGPAFHDDGQNFAKAYDIQFLGKDGEKDFAYQSTYAISTRMLGAMFAMHSDEKGLVLPPRMAPRKVVIVPIYANSSRENVLKAAETVKKSLADYDAFIDDRDDCRPGFKFNEWELKGIPIRIEIGEKDIAKKEVVVVIRDNGKKESVPIERVSAKVKISLEEMHKRLFENSKKLFEERITRPKNFSELQKAIEKKLVAVVPLASDGETEDILRSKTDGAKVLFIAPDAVRKGEKCVVSGKDAAYLVYVGKTY